MKISAAVLFFLVLIHFNTSLLAQKETPFAAQQKLYAKGNSVLIGNTILGKHPKYAFDEIKTLNDQVPLNFVDVDEDDSTFSSSSASFTLPASAKKIKFAGLYWGGLYPAQSSSKRKGKRRMKYDYLGERDPKVNEIKLKINDVDYEDIIGQVIFDSKAKGPFAKESPYACFADVTTQVSKLKNEVSITVANIRATTGFIEGGAAAGWLLYVVYEDDSQAPKYFTSYTGFREVSKEVVEVVFEDLQPATKNTTASKIMMATLEGDTRIKGDACAIYSDVKEQFMPLTTENRPANNFFNSTVSVGYDVPTTRTPASKNTLGFDLLKMNVPDSTITTNTTDATIRLSTKQDRFYTFFLAFETEIEAVVLEAQTTTVVLEKEVIMDETIVAPVVKKPVGVVAGPPPVFTNPVPQNTNVSVVQPKPTADQEVPISGEQAEVAEIDIEKEAELDEEERLTIDLNNIKSRPVVSSKGMIAGYYLVTNVFESKTNAAQWKSRLNEEGYNARTFINEENETTYVYIESSKTPEEMQGRKEVVRQIPHLAKTWVCRVNL